MVFIIIVRVLMKILEILIMTFFYICIIWEVFRNSILDFLRCFENLVLSIVILVEFFGIKELNLIVNRGVKMKL